MNLITRQNELDAAISDLSKSDFVTIDTEFIRETTFWPELCLIQLATPDTTALIDPLAPGIDLKPFFELMANEQVLKVFHAARQDIEIIFHLGDLIPHVGVEIGARGDASVFARGVEDLLPRDLAAEANHVIDEWVDDALVGERVADEHPCHGSRC